MPVNSFAERDSLFIDRLDNILSSSLSEITRLSLITKLGFLISALLALWASASLLEPVSPRNSVLSKTVQSFLLDKTAFFKEQKNILNKLIDTRKEAIKSLQKENLEPVDLQWQYDFAEDLKKGLSMAVGDLNGDRYPDVVITTDIGEPNALYFNQEGKGLVRSCSLGGNRSKTTCLALADTDQDGDLDIVMGDFYKQSQIWLNNGNGEFSEGPRFGKPDQFTKAIETGDLNGDSYPDMVLMNHRKNIAVYLNDGHGNYPQPVMEYPLDIPTSQLSLDDVNTDGTLDIVVYARELPEILFFENDSHGRFTCKTNDIQPAPADNGYKFYLKGNKPTGHKPSILYFERDNRASLYEIGRSQIQKKQEMAFPGNFLSVSEADLNQDGLNELYIGGQLVQNQIYLPERAGNFSKYLPFGKGGARTLEIQFADMDQDGDLDVITLSVGSPCSVFENKLPFRIRNSPINLTAFSGHSAIPVPFTNLVSIKELSSMQIYGGWTGFRKGSFIQKMPSDGEFIPSAPFFPGEKVSIIVPEGFQSKKGLSFETSSFLIRYAAVPSAGFALSPLQTAFGEAGGQTASLLLADVNRDGNLDIVTGGDSNHTCSYLNQGKGIFNKAPISDAVRFPVSAMTSGDFDGDGDVDLVLCGDNRNTPLLMQNNGQGDFTKAGEFPQTLGSIVDIQSEDLNGDGTLDIAMAEKIDKQGLVSIYFNQGGGRFFSSSKVQFSVPPMQSIRFGDMDGDGDMDMVLVTYDGMYDCYYNNGKGKFLDDVKRLVEGYPKDFFALGYLDGNGVMDIAVGSNYPHSSENPLHLTIILDNYGHEFPDNINRGNQSGWVRDIALGDMDGDGDMDIVQCVSNSENDIRIFLNNGDRTFSKMEWNSGSDSAPFKLALGDMDQDGDLDIVLTRTNGLHSILWNKPSPNNVAIDPKPGK